MFTRFRFSQSAVHPPECRQRSSSMPPTSGAERTAKRKEVDEEAPTDATLNLAKKSKHATRVLPRKWQERYRSICDDCFGLVQECTHFPEVPLRLLIVGHNPSDHAWQSGFSYSNPTNRLWKLLAGEYYKTVWKGVLPKDWTMSDQNKMPHALGIGFSDLGIEPGNDASKYDRKTMTKWKHDFYARMRQHLRRVAATLHENDASASMAMKCSNAYQHGPLLVAFSGKRQFTYLFDPPAKHSIPNGKQEHASLPPDWPLPPSCEVWVLPSTSGRAAMTEAQRCQPYMDLAARFHELAPSASVQAPNFTCDANSANSVP